jgi:drug/metabolite transporter (DMT)-like permease
LVSSGVLLITAAGETNRWPALSYRQLFQNNEVTVLTESAMKRDNQVSWVLYSIIAMIGFATMILLFKKLTIMEPKTEVINFYFFMFTSIAFFLFSTLRKVQLHFPGKSLALFILLAVIAVVANYASVSAIRSAPNPGYVRGIQSFEVVIITIAAFFLFRSEITTVKVIGMLLSLCGVVLLSI